MKSDKDIFNSVLKECRLFYNVRIIQKPNRKTSIPNGYADLVKRTIFLYVKDRSKLYAKQASILIHEFGHIQHYEYVRGLLYAYTDDVLEDLAWKYGLNHFENLGLLPRGIFKFRDWCLDTHRIHNKIKQF